ncbi:MAG: hypothetical protein U5J62_05580 [Desulfurivibrio sp.]|nr:hypothetical protein [Desulfurivibrio sp.]
MLANSARSERHPFQVDVGVEAVALHLLDQVTQPIGMAVQVRVVDLEDITG